MRISRPNAAPASAHDARARTGGISGPLEIITRSRIGRAGLFYAPLGDGEGDRARPQTRSGRGTAGAEAEGTPAAVTGQLATPGSRAGGREPRKNALGGWLYLAVSICDNVLYHIMILRLLTLRMNIRFAGVSTFAFDIFLHEFALLCTT